MKKTDNYALFIENFYILLRRFSENIAILAQLVEQRIRNA